MTGPTLDRRLLAQWSQRRAGARLLWPVSQIYRAAWALRQAGYRAGLLKATRLPVPVVVVGNVLAGGVGKTPVVIALVEHLASRGIVAGVVSRGHGRRPPPGDDGEGLEVQAQSAPSAVGDEPLLIRRRTGAPVFVGRQRAAVARRLLALHPEVRVVICDDGLQHVALARDIEICVFDDRGIGNGWLLPAGPLREPWPRAVDMVLHTGRQPAFGGYRGDRQLADDAVGSDGRLTSMAAIDQTGPVAAVAGIAQPERFFEMLRERGMGLSETYALPDHADFESDAATRSTIAAIGPRTTLLCTEKDAAKLWRLRPDALAVPLEFSLEPEFLAYFDRLVDARLSSASRARRPA
ncbi:tetraacyldisaccharide 4'-kinase [Xylophilus sp. Kf1]|nr:tetraacyldisaccharide 4'-kinase [Xylophilus sp. Kf1]